MAQILELAHLAQRHRVAEMQIGAGGIHAKLDVERLAPLELLQKLLLGNDVRRARFDDTQLFFSRKHR